MPRKQTTSSRPTPKAVTAAPLSLQEDMRDWWITRSEMELQKLLPKVNEYSATDLMIVGSTLGGLWRGDRSPSAEVSLELASAFYALGKVSRAFGAYQAGQLPTLDTWEDAAIYVRIIQRVRSSGGWPGSPGQDREQLLTDLQQWWTAQTEDEIARLLPKLDEYGTLDLIIMGNTLGVVWEQGSNASPTELVEFTLATYALSKLARAYGAYQNGKLPSDDTWLDASTYIRMILRTKSCGGWPGRQLSR